MRATRIIHDETEKMIYFEDARLEVLRLADVLLAVSFDARSDGQAQDRRSRCRSSPTTSDYGCGVDGALFLGAGAELRLHPDADCSPTKQGLLMQGEWRHRLMNGSYSIKAAGIFQADPGAFDKPHDRHRTTTRATALFRGSFDTHRPVRLNNNWVWGWDGTARDRQDGHPGLRRCAPISP